MKHWLKLSHHTHTGKIRPHEHTSYFPLSLLLILVGYVLIGYSSVVLADTPYTGPESGAVGLSGTMPADPPTEAATITSPVNQERFSTSPVTVRGTCPEDTLVQIYKNDIFAGSTPCTDQGTFSLDVDLLIGRNVLVARVYDNLNQAGPDSNKVVTFYDAVPPQAGPLTGLDFGGNQLVLNTDAVYRGVFPEREFKVPIDILGGTPPYALNVQWGDSTNRVVPRDNNTPFKINHTYQKPGTYQISLQASDSVGRVAFLTVAAIVNGQPEVPTGTGASTAEVNRLLLLWPLYTGAAAVVASFWLGEQREKRLLRHRGLLLSTQ